MLPMFNVMLVSVCALFIGFTIAVIVLDQNKEDLEEVFGEGCSRSRHIFKHDENREHIYCFCGQEVLAPSKDHEFYIIKM